MHMQFSKNSDNKYFFSQPHQPFFVLAFINAVVLMVIFMLAYKGIIHISIPALNLHTYGLTYLLFTPAFFGFLLTTFPRFASTSVIEKSVYMRTFSFFYLGATLYVLGSIVSPIFSALGMILILIGHIYGMMLLRNIYLTTTMQDKHDIFWILTAMKFGVLAHILFICGQLFYAPLIGLANEIGIYLYLFLLTFSVAQRMVPFFSHSLEEKNEHLLKVIFALLLLHIVLEGFYANSSFIVDIAIGVLIGKEILRWKFQFPNPQPLLWILHTALYWVPVAFTVGAITNFITLVTGISFLALDIHLIGLGFVFTMLIGFGTRVTIGHSGNPMQADTFTKMLFYGTQLVVLLRVLVSVMAAFGMNFMILFDVAVTAWVLFLLLWAWRFFPLLIQGKKLAQ